MYLRKSRAEELSDTTAETLKRHKETLTNFAKEHELDIVVTYEEVISGENLYTRTEMLRLLSDVEANKLDAVLCMDIDRLGRGSMSQQGVILETLKAANVKIITPRKTYDLNNDLDEEYTEFQTFFARRELKTIKRRMRQGINKSLQDGGYIANPPYGYQSCRIGKLPSLVIDKTEAEFVKMIFDLYANKGYGCHTIAETLNQLGAVPKRGANFSRETVKNIIQNQVYLGKIVWNKRKHRRPDDKNMKHWSIANPKSEWIVSNGIHPAIIDNEIFEKANEILTNRYHPPYFSGKLTNPLAGIVVCARCGGKMERRKFNHSDTVYFICPKAGCSKMTPFNLIEQTFISTIHSQLNILKSKAFAEVAEDDGLIQKAISTTNREISTATIQKNKLHDLLEQGVYSTQVFLERKSALDVKISSLNSSLKNLKTKLANTDQMHLRAVCEKTESVLLSYDSAGIDEKNRMLKMIVERSDYYKEKSWDTDNFILRVFLKDV